MFQSNGDSHPPKVSWVAITIGLSFIHGDHSIGTTADIISVLLHTHCLHRLLDIH